LGLNKGQKVERGQTNNAMVTSLKIMNFDENLPIMNKTNHQSKGGGVEVQDGRTKSWQRKNPPKRGWITRGIRTNQVTEHAFW
jgi:hypothetical protein